MSLIAKVESIVKLEDHRWTIDQFHAMIETGILTENDKVELLFGKIVNMSPVGKAHAAIVKKVNRVFTHRFFDQEIVIGIQDPVTLGNDSEPEPDISVAKGFIEKFAEEGHPGPDDLLLIIEVADSTVHRDRSAKKLSYALAGIQEYWVINVFEKEIEQFTLPQQDGGFAGYKKYGLNDIVETLSLGKFAVSDLLI